MSYWDTSALAKLFVAEADSRLFEQHAAESAAPAVTACCRRRPALPLRTLDALHLASARVPGETEIVATDTKLQEAASILGFTLFPATPRRRGRWSVTFKPPRTYEKAT